MASTDRWSDMKIIADENIPFVRECFSSVGEVITCPGREITARLVRDADALLVRSVTLVNADLLAGSSVRFIGTTTAGFEHVDTDYLAEHGIGFASAPGSNANSTAEYVIAAVLTLADKYKLNLRDKSIGIVGVGNVGSRVAKKTTALGMKVLLNDPPLYRQTKEAKYAALEELFGCDFITLHTPLTFEGIDKTFHLADEGFFGSLKSNCVFLNTARGPVADTAALTGAIKSGKLCAAALDVWENEPNIDVELLKVVDIATPHIAGYSLDGKVAGMIMIYRSLCEYFGEERKIDGGDFLGACAPEITINTTSPDEQQILTEAVGKVYNIKADDLELRRILTVPQHRRGKFFDNLRKNYRVRREFGNTRVILKNASDSLAAKLKGIGFKVTNAKSKSQ